MRPEVRREAGGRRVYRRRTVLLGAGACGFLVACGGGSGSPTPTAPPATNTPADPPTSPPRTNTASPTSLPPTATAVPPTATAPLATATPVASTLAPIGFPLDPTTRAGIVRGEAGNRAIAWGEGPGLLEYSRDDQPSDDPVRANCSGWNARIHIEYEGRPAVDWYVPEGTAVRATMSGTATMYAVTVANPFEVYGVSREPYIGNPDRSRAPISPFPGPGGGMGLLVRVSNDAYHSDYGHLAVAASAANVPSDAWHGGYGPETLAGEFANLRGFDDWTAVAEWEVARGDLIGYTGDTGYSEAPHLHYAIALADGTPLCGTQEPGVPDGGWLFLDKDP